MGPLFKKFKQDILSISFVGFGLFLGLALVSFNPLDPSFNSIGTGLRATNYCGIVGSFLADLLYQFFGLSSWVIVMSSLKAAYDMYQGKKLAMQNIRFIWGTLLILNVATLLSVYLPEKKIYSEQIYLGGLLGLGIAKILVQAFNFVGVQVLLWSSMTMLVVFYLEKSIHELIEIPTDFLQLLFKKIDLAKKLKNLKQTLFIEIPKKTKNNVDKSVEKVKNSAPFLVSLKDEEGAQELQAKQNEEEDKKIQNGVFRKGEQLRLADDEEQAEELESDNEENLDSNAEDEMLAEEDNNDSDDQPAPKRKVIAKAKVPRRVENWVMPKLSLLEDPPATRIKIDKQEIQRKADLLTDKLRNFSIEGQIVDAKPGPLVTMYEFKPNADVKISKISELEDDLSLALSSESVRCVGHIPGRDVVGIETSNLKRETVFYKDLIAEEQFWNESITLPIALGRQVDGTPRIVDLRKMPHLLIAGTTGSGKSVFVSSIITGLLYRHSPKSLRLILIDPKMVDLAAFSKIPHLILPHVSESKKAASAFRWAVREMDKRYKSLSKFGARGLEAFNEKVSQLSNDEIAEHEKINNELEESGKGKLDQYYYQPLPYIVIVVDELADLMVTDKQNIEQPIQRLTQMARACGMHLILATQSPRKDVVTGLIKTNIPGRIALKVASKMDSRIILDDSGAERLLPNGDMLFLAPGVGKPTRHHGPYLSDTEIHNVVQFWGQQSEPEFDPLALKILDGFVGGGEGAESGSGGDFGDQEEEYDERYDEILSWASEQKEVSASLIQRRFRLGYPRAARLIEVFEREGVVGPANGSKPRQVLVGNMKDI